jgi:hypothetical protein
VSEMTWRGPRVPWGTPPNPRAWVLLLAGLAATVAACQGVLGIGDRVLDPDLSEGGTEASVPDTSAGGDSSVTDSGAGHSDSTAKDSGEVVDSAASMDAGPCGDLQTNPDNCGRCGHGCFGGGCEGGVCQPVTLAPNIEPWNLAVDDASVYWTQPIDGLVAKVDKSLGGTPVTLLSNPSPNMAVLFPIQVATDGTNVYVTDQEGANAYACAVGGCGNNPKVLAVVDQNNNQGGTFAITVDPGFVYFSDLLGNVWRVSKTGNGDAGASLLGAYLGGQASANFAGATSITVDSTFAYFTNSGDNTVQKLPLEAGVDGSSTTLVATGNGSGNVIVNANGLLYWTVSGNPGTVDSVSVTGGTPNAVAGSQPYPIGVALDQTNIYWLDYGSNMNGTSGNVLTCPLTNCSSPTVLASGVNNGLAVVVDNDAVYWTARGNAQTGENGAIMKVAKP